MNYLLSFLLLLSSFITIQITAAPYEIIEDKATTPLLNPTFSKTQSLKIRLENDLEVYLISDPLVDKSSAALSVATGSWDDPEEHPGMAHFLEHLLFLGTKKYPVESSYQRFITEHAGQYNAFTASDMTAYLFSIEHKAYAEAIDRLSDFFKNPLFNPSGVDRELHAIDQEHAKNHDSDEWREYFVLKELANPDHPFHAFSTGNAQSLKNVTQDELIKWYKAHYSANKMRLITISNLPIESLRDLIIGAFSDIPNYNLPTHSIDLPIIQDSIKGHMVYIDPTKNKHVLTLIWDLPPAFAGMRDTKPEELVGHVLQHQGRTSLLAELKRSKLAESIVSGGQLYGDNNIQFLIKICLTDEGVRNIDEVIYRTYETLANLKQRNIPQYLFDEIQMMDKVNYQYQARHDSFNAIMSSIQLLRRESLSTFPEQSCMISSFDPKAVKNLLEHLTPENCLYTLMAPESLTGVAFENNEQWMGVPYTVKAISSQNLKDWEQVINNPRIDIPSLNPFIPEELALHTPAIQHDSSSIIEYEMPIPSLILDDERGKVYAAYDSYYLLPQISWTYYIRTPSITAAEPESIVLADIYTSCLMDELSSYIYPAAIAGLGFNVTPGANGVYLTVTGFSDKAEELFNDLVVNILNFQPTEAQYKTHKEILLKSCKSFDTNMPVIQAKELFLNAIYKNFVTHKAKASAIRKVSFTKFQKFVTDLYKTTSIDGMLYGNMPSEQPSKITNFLIRSLGSTPYPETEHLAKEVASLPDENGPFYIERKSDTKSHAAILAIEIAPYSLKGKAAATILMQGMKQPFFSTLRTKQQTGYIVSNSIEEHELHLYNTFTVQSNTHNGKDLLARFELFIEEFMQEISKSEITLDRFENIRHCLVSQLRQPPKSVEAMGSMLYNLATEHGGDFQLKEKLIEAFDTISYMEFLEYAHQIMGKQNKRRLALLMKGSQDSGLEYTKMSDGPQKLTKGTNATTR